MHSRRNCRIRQSRIYFEPHGLRHTQASFLVSQAREAPSIYILDRFALLPFRPFPWGRFASLQNIIEAACGANTARAGEGGERSWRGLRVEGRSLESKTSQPDSLHLTQCNLVLCSIARLGNHRRIGPCCLLPCSPMRSIWG
jgi:hypothetical protein